MMFSNKNLQQSLVIGVVACVISACGAGSSVSGTGEDELAPLDFSAFAGIYRGSETLILTNTETQETADEQENGITISINQLGQLNISSSSGTTGTAQVRQNQTFSFFSDAAQQFSGRCSQGQIELAGRVSENQVTANYTSSNLICDGTAHELNGSLTATR